MVKKKKEEVFDDKYEPEFDEDDVDITEDNFDYDDDADEPNFDDDSPSDSLGLATQISKESDTSKAFKELPKEVRYSFYDKVDKNEVKHFSRAYRTHQYIEKIIDLRIEEDKKASKARMSIKEVKDKLSLKKYFENVGRSYLLADIEDFNEDDFKKIFVYIKKLKPNHLLKTIDDNKKNITKLYNEYNEVNNIPSYIDDMGNIGKIVDTSVTSMGFKGNASQHSIMTIQAVKNEDIQKKAESKRAFGFMDAIKNKLG